MLVSYLPALIENKVLICVLHYNFIALATQIRIPETTGLYIYSDGIVQSDILFDESLFKQVAPKYDIVFCILPLFSVPRAMRIGGNGVWAAKQLGEALGKPCSLSCMHPMNVCNRGRFPGVSLEMNVTYDTAPLQTPVRDWLSWMLRLAGDHTRCIDPHSA